MTNYDRIAASVPANRTAGEVTGKGEHWEPTKKIDVPHWDTPPVVLDPPKTLNLIGSKFGRFTVVGYLGKMTAGKGASPMWLARCACGDYEGRSARAVRNPANGEDCCGKCRALIHLKREEYFRRTGRNKETMP
jgi:hypothetical protein